MPEKGIGPQRPTQSLQIKSTFSFSVILKTLGDDLILFKNQVLVLKGGSYSLFS